MNRGIASRILFTIVLMLRVSVGYRYDTEKQYGYQPFCNLHKKSEHLSFPVSRTFIIIVE